MARRTFSWYLVSLRLVPLLLMGILWLGFWCPSWAAPPSSPPASPTPSLLPTRVEGTFDRTSPRRSFDGFMKAARAHDYVRAAHYLEFHDLNRERQALGGASLAKELAFVIDRKLAVDPDQLSDNPDVEPPAGASSEAVGTLDLSGEPIAISLTHTHLEDGTSGWLISKNTVAMIPALYKAYGESWLEEQIPDSWSRWRFFDIAAWQGIGLFVALLLAYTNGYALGTLLLAIAHRVVKRTPTKWDDKLVSVARSPLRLGIGVFTMDVLTGLLALPASADLIVRHILVTFFVIATAWLMILWIGVGTRTLEGQLAHNTMGEQRSRGLRTQLTVMRRVASILVGFVAGATILIQFEFVRSVGMSILASAGIAGVVVGLAAQKSLAGVIAGVQLSITQPIRIGDTVSVEGEWGNIEQINLTYAVVRLIDSRRLIVPITRFLEHSFQNWTKVDTHITGTFVLATDYITPVPPVRTELERLCKLNPLWDQRTCQLEVMEITDKCMLLRAYVSSSNAEKSWRLRCELRESLISFLQSWDRGVYLPRGRNENVIRT